MAVDPSELKRIADRLYDIADAMSTEESDEGDNSSEDSSDSSDSTGVSSEKKSAIMAMLKKKAGK